jgi:hypothetical protein
MLSEFFEAFTAKSTDNFVNLKKFCFNEDSFNGRLTFLADKIIIKSALPMDDTYKRIKTGTEPKPACVRF